VEKIDGQAVIYLAKQGSGQQFETLGLKSVGEQLKFKDTVLGTTNDMTAKNCNEKKRTKPTKLDLFKLTPLKQRIYKTK